MPRRYEPTDHVTAGEAFGDPGPKGAAVRAKDVPGAPATWTAMAWLQHLAAQGVRSAFDIGDRASAQRLANNLDRVVVDPNSSASPPSTRQLEYLVDKLYGRRPATFEDLAAWTLVAGVETWPAPMNSAELRGVSG